MQIWSESGDAFICKKTHQHSLQLALGLLTAFGRRTISRAICARGMQFWDWSGYYRFFSRARWSPVVLKQKLLEHLSRHLGPGDPLVIAVDDTNKPKSGRKIPATGYFYNAKSPHFARSFSWQLRFITLSALLTPQGLLAQAKGILLNLKLAPKVAKPGSRATDEQREQYKKMTKLWTLTSQLVEQLHLLRVQMDGLRELAERLLVVVADASYCNKNVIRNLPERCLLVSRTRKDIKLYEPAEPDPGAKGRKRVYGERLPTPDDIRKDDNYPWQTCTIWAAGKLHELRYKTLEPVLWKSVGARPMRLVVIAPLGYRLRNGSKLLYRNPAYLLISDPDYPLQKAIQHYFHRWEIEQNHRDIKAVFGVGDAQVRNPRSVARQFSFAAACYSWLSLASLDAEGGRRGARYAPRAKWRNDIRSRPSALDLTTRLRMELLMFETGGQEMEFCVDGDLAPKDAKYTQAAVAWLAQTVPKGISESFWSSILYADA